MEVLVAPGASDARCAAAMEAIASSVVGCAVTSMTSRRMYAWIDWPESLARLRITS